MLKFNESDVVPEKIPLSIFALAPKVIFPVKLFFPYNVLMAPWETPESVIPSPAIVNGSAIVKPSSSGIKVLFFCGLKSYDSTDGKLKYYSNVGLRSLEIMNLSKRWFP